MPLAGKLKTRTEDESLMRRMIMEAVLMIQSQANPRLVGQKLLAHLPPSIRDAVQQEDGKQEEQEEEEQGAEITGGTATSPA